MQYVGRFVSSVYNTITPNINPATLSGAIDVIVVERQVEVPIDAQGNTIPEEERDNDSDQDSSTKRTKKVTVKKTELASSPFHVRFGKMSVLRPAERKVTLHLNNSQEPLPFAMKVGESGEAFFVLEIDDEEERNRIPDNLVTSPILSAITSPLTSPEKAALDPLAPMRKTSEMEPLDLGKSRATLESETDDQDTNTRSATTTLPSSSTKPTIGTFPSDEQPSSSSHENSKEKLEENKSPGGVDEEGDLEVPSDSRRTGSGPAGSSSLLGKMGDAAGRVAVGVSAAGNAKLEKVADKAEKQANDQTGTKVDQDRGDAHRYQPEQGGLEGKRRQQAYEQVDDSNRAPSNQTEKLEKQLKDRAMGIIQAEVQDTWQHSSLDGKNTGKESSAEQTQESYPEPFGNNSSPKISAASMPEKTAKINAQAATAASETFPVTTTKHAQFLGEKRLEPIESEAGGLLEPTMVDASSFRVRHERRDSERDQKPAKDAAEEDDDHTTTISPGDDDATVEAKLAVKEKSKREGLQYMLDMDGYKMTLDGEDIAYQEGHRLADELPLSKRHGGNGRWHRPSKSIPDFKRFSSETDLNLDELPAEVAEAIEAGVGQPFEKSSTESYLQTNKLVETPDATEPSKTLVQAPVSAQAKVKPKTTYAKTLRLTSDQLKSLNLRKGANTITFSVTSSYSGVATCTARIFLWEGSHKVVVSDIDGTITKSDALGHVFTMIGRDWTHLGVAKLYTDIARNGYRIMYLTSRAIGQADTTRDYLKGVRQNNYQLPDGPVIMSPDRLMASLHREVILRKPEVFKMACLRDIARLFGADPRTAHAQRGGNLNGVDDNPLAGAKDKGAGAEASPGASPATDMPVTSDNDSTHSLTSNPSTPDLSAETKKKDHSTPFYAGFGNRITDALSYRSVNIPSSRIFTIDSNGEVKMELLELAGYKSSYIHMTDLVDQMFPPITAKEEKEPRRPEFNDFNYWRPSISEIELPPDDELLGTPPVSPALSARSGKSVRSLPSDRSATSDGGQSAAESSETAVEKPGRLSRFGLGSLGLSRKPSVPEEPRSNSVGPGSESDEAADLERSFRAVSAEPDFAPSSYGSGATSWAAPWRRNRASSPTVTSPLVGPVITTEPESEDERFYDSGGDDDVSAFGGRGGRLDDEVSEDEGDLGPDEVEAYSEMNEEDDPLFATGEIRFEWRG